MLDRDFITTHRVGDDEIMMLRHADIVMLATNANEHGPIDGTCAVYFRMGLAVAVNATVEDVAALIREKELSQ